MFQAIKSSFPSNLFLVLAVLLAYTDVVPLVVFGFAWLGSVRIFNLASSRFPFSPLIHWIHAVTFEIPALLGVMVIRLIPTKERVQGKGQPILLVHGYMNHGSVWQIPKKRLEALGLGPVYTVNLGHPFRSIRLYAEKVKEKAEKIAQETGRSDLILIGHSMGGIVSSWYATQLAPPNTVTDVVTIGSPLHGTRMARIGFGENAREMRLNSPFLQQLRDAMMERKEIRFHHIGTKSDLLIIPGSSSIIEQNNHFVFDDIGHASLLYSKRVVNKIAEWIPAKAV